MTVKLSLTPPPLRRPLNTLERDMRAVVRLHVERWKDFLDDEVLEFFRPWLGPLADGPEPDARHRIYVCDHRLRPLMILTPKTRKAADRFSIELHHLSDLRDAIDPRDRNDGPGFHEWEEDPGSYWRGIKPYWPDDRATRGHIAGEITSWALVFRFEGRVLDPERPIPPFTLTRILRKWAAKDLIDWKRREADLQSLKPL